MLKQKQTKRKSRDGVLTVEAAIVVPIFVMVMVFVLSFMQLFYFHLVMQQALHNVGATLAQYGYVIDRVTDIEKFALQDETKTTENDLVTGVDTVIKSGTEMVTLLKGGITLDNIGEIIQQGKDFGSDANSLVETLKSVNKDKVINYLLVSALNGADDVFVRWMVGDYLNAMQAQNGLIDEESIEYAFYVESGTKDFLLVVEYDYNFPMFISQPIRIQQAVRVHPWVGGDTKGIYNDRLIGD